MATGGMIREMIASLEEHENVTLSPVERLLLATDGTVTHMLEALIRGPVNVDILSRDVTGGTLDRRVVLERGSDGSRLVWASSDINLYALDADLEDALVDGDIGIGELLREEYAETRREITDMTPVWQSSPAFPAFIDGTAAVYLRREYDVYSDQTRIMTIEEFFPKGFL